MNPNGFETIALVRDYLASEVVPALPDHIATEVKAAVKLLGTASKELAALVAVLPGEIAELRDLCEDSHAVLGEPDARSENSNENAQSGRALGTHAGIVTADLPELLAEQKRLGEQATVMIAQLQARVAGVAENDVARKAQCDLLTRFFVTLGRQARRRTPWQSVFPHTADAGRLVPEGSPG